MTAPAWYEVVWKDPRRGEVRLRWVRLPEARVKAKDTARRKGVPVQIWATYRDRNGRVTSTAFVEEVTH